MSPTARKHLLAAADRLRHEGHAVHAESRMLWDVVHALRRRADQRPDVDGVALYSASDVLADYALEVGALSARRNDAAIAFYIAIRNGGGG